MITADGILAALARAGDFTVRMIRGVFAQAAFATEVLPALGAGWIEKKIGGDPPYDFLLTDDPESGTESTYIAGPDIRVQVKMQRSEAGRPLLASDQWRSRVTWPNTHYIVEVQRSRKGVRAGRSTRPYRFGEFDILAVSLGPARGRWGDFMFTLERWLLPNPASPDEVLTYQPVPPWRDDWWTDDFLEAAGWLRSERAGRIPGDLPIIRSSRNKKGRADT